MAYGFLLFFGAFGIHRFYLGRPYTALLYMLTGGLAGIGVLYDIFAIPFYVDTANACLC